MGEVLRAQKARFILNCARGRQKKRLEKGQNTKPMWKSLQQDVMSTTKKAGRKASLAPVWTKKEKD